MGKTGNLIESKVKSFASGMETRMDTLRKAKVKEIDKKLEAAKKKAEKSKKPAGEVKTKAKTKEETGDDLVMKLSFSMSKSPATKGRTGKEQAIEVAEGDSWTCAGSHMNDSARHINMYTHGPGKTGKKYMIDPVKAFGSDEKHICTAAKFKSEWAAEMKAQDLRNYAGGKGYGDGDGYHLELPNSRIPKDDPECKTCVDEYCRLVVMEGYSNNTKFEAAWKSAVKAPMDKWKKAKKKIENAKRIEELKKMRFTGKMSGSGALFKKVTDSKKATCLASGSILPPKEIIPEAGKQVVLPIPFVAAPKKGTFTNLYIMTILHITFETYAHLSQTFVKEARVDCALTMKGLLSYAATASASCKIDIALTAGSTEPTGSAVIDYSFDGLGPDDHKGQIVYDIKGLKTKATKVS